ncbi:virus tail fibre assembly protein, lambda gpK [Kosakonia arachidis]|uniref:Virus tail fibre assembly protein, lambda gpK n=1 Tax=Kosakonia arachidis TaxID=551989 RepID=A0A1I7E387_9ENTR|nr:tail fiber assembly protein [Kosakonia arachidis]SFU18376.1 virus tail fibre assembly protein, lambda gpK [Kosakonia arachidis]
MTMQSGTFKKYEPLEKWGKYTPEEVATLSPDELELYYIAKSPGMNIVFLKDENDSDWYLWLKTLSTETLKISFNPDSKEIVHFSYDASTIFPVNQIVVEIAPENVPHEFTAAGEKAIGGAFIFDGGKITAAPVDDEAEAQRKKQERLTQANNMIATLQDAVELGIATDSEKTLLTEWKTYRVVLNRIRPEDAPEIDWPELPA